MSPRHAGLMPDLTRGSALAMEARGRLRPGIAIDFVGHESLSLNDTRTAATYPIRRLTPIQSGPVSHSEDGRVP